MTEVWILMQDSFVSVTIDCLGVILIWMHWEANDIHNPATPEILNQNNVSNSLSKENAVWSLEDQLLKKLGDKTALLWKLWVKKQLKEYWL